MNDINIIGATITISVAIIAAAIIFGNNVYTGLARAAAIQSHMSAIEYSHWMDDVR